ncbi:uncharacterized protein LOC112043820 isoform X2 [Bicyclus anynana]|uniref:Uncharacterized protein LOC112043820 isoform X2 n=1 Tax=Bicyclus anynana TaxID=110368 RepID=A0A6J1MQK5_BICAN|nr:uncharacterized protein LOC112043820 isoform X2 [Bicyclus anynana]
MEPEKPFACTMPDCGMTFTNEDHLHVHTKKHDMVLQLGMEQKAAFVADQTPTPTRFIRNCEEVGLFQDLQNVAVNPFDEGFKRAMETKQGLLNLEGPSSSEDALHTPHLVFPLESGDFQRNITISRSSSDESGAIKEYETTKISKLTNEVTTISRIVGKDDVSILKLEETTKNKDSLNETSVSYTNNVIIHSNVEIRQDINIDTKKVSNNADSVVKDTLSIDDLVKLTDNNKNKAIVPPIMSQKSLDFVVDSLTTDSIIQNDNLAKNIKRNIDNNDKLNRKDIPKRNIDTDRVSNEIKKTTLKTNNEEYEVIIKLPSGKHMKMKPVDEIEIEKPVSAKEMLNNTLRNKNRIPVQKQLNNQIIQNIVPIPGGTLIPVTLVNSNLMNQTFPILQNVIPKMPIQPLPAMVKRNYKTVKRKKVDVEVETDSNNDKHSKANLSSRCEASRRYRVRLKQSMHDQSEENKQLRELNQRLMDEKAMLQLIITQHLVTCPHADQLTRMLQEKFLSVLPTKNPD